MHLNQRPVVREQLLHCPLHGPVGPDGQPAHEENAAPDGLRCTALRPRKPQLLPVGPLGGLPGDLHEGSLRLGRQRELHKSVAPRVTLLAHNEAPHELPILREEAPQALGVGLGKEVAHEERGLGLALSQPHLLAADLCGLELLLHPPPQRGAVRLRPGAHAAQRAALAVRQRREPRQGRPAQGGEQPLEGRLHLAALRQVRNKEDRQRQPVLRDRGV